MWIWQVKGNRSYWLTASLLNDPALVQCLPRGFICCAQKPSSEAGWSSKEAILKINTGSAHWKIA
jgi:hypothetical protein